MAQLQDTVNTLINSGGGGWSDFKITAKSQNTEGSVSYTTSYPAFVYLSPDSNTNYGNISLTANSGVTFALYKEDVIRIGFVKKDTTITMRNTHRYGSQSFMVAEFI